MNDERVNEKVSNHRRGALLVAALLAATCALVLAAGASADEPQESPAAVSAVPVPPGQIDAAVAQLDSIVADAMQRTGVPGMAVAVVHDDQVVYEKGFGVRRVGTDEPVDANTVFQLASLSKTVGATVVAGVVGSTGVGWNDPVVKYLPWFRIGDAYVTRHVTIADLYSHRSGLPDHAGDLLEDLGYGQAQILRRLRFEPLEPFRASYEYTNFGLTAAAEAVARSQGLSWADLSQKVLYGPLGMTSTSSRFSDYERSPDRADLHVKVGDEWEAKYVRQPDAQAPAGGVSSSVGDMARWLRLELAHGSFEGDQVIGPDALLETWVPHSLAGPPDTPVSRSSFYGLGTNVGYDETGRLRLSHSGAFGLGAATAFTLLPSEDLGIVILTNGMPVGAPEAVAASFMDLVEVGKIQRDWVAGFGGHISQGAANPSRLAGEEPPADPRPARPAAAYAGTYANRYYGPLRVVATPGGLVMRLGPHGVSKFRLSHWDNDEFSYLPRGENAVGIAAVTFAGSRNGKPASVTVENLDKNGLGSFRRRLG